MFFAELGELRDGDGVSAEVVLAAQDACDGGVPVGSLQDFAQHLEDEFPALGFYDASLTASGPRAFPARLAAFIVSITGRWAEVEQHCVYAVYGNHALKLLAAARGTMSDERYRDETAGALQHVANGLWPAVRAAGATGHLEVPFRPDPWPVVDAAREAVRVQLRAATLRAEKYAAPGSSTTHSASYRGALLALANACETLAAADPSCSTHSSMCTQKMRQLADNLSAQKSMAAASTAEALQLVRKERRTPLLALSLLPPSAPAPRSPTAGETACRQCQAARATHRGFICGCLCLCADCAVEGALLECPACKEYTEFVKV